MPKYQQQLALLNYYGKHYETYEMIIAEYMLTWCRRCPRRILRISVACRECLRWREWSWQTSPTQQSKQVSK